MQIHWNVLNLFGGAAIARLAVHEAGIRAERFVNAEIDPKPARMAARNFSDIVRLGDVRRIDENTLPYQVDLLIGGAPCQDHSIAGKRRGEKGDSGHLIWECVRLVKLLRPRYYLFENVPGMALDLQQRVGEALGSEWRRIDAALFGPQRRERIYISNIPLSPLPVENKIVLRDVLESKVDGRFYLPAQLADVYRLVPEGGCWRDLPTDHPERKAVMEYRAAYARRNPGKSFAGSTSVWRVYSLDAKAPTLTTSPKQGFTRLVIRDPKTGRHRYLTPLECERLQGWPDNFTEGFRDDVRYKAIGNGFSLPVVTHLLRGAHDRR